MSQYPSDPNQPGQPGPNTAPAQPILGYQTSPAFRNDSYGSAPILVLLHGIFMAVCAGLNAIGSILKLLNIGMLAFSSMSAPSGRPPAGAVAPVMVMTAAYGFTALTGVAAAVVSGIAAVKLLRKRPNSWGWGLAAAIVNCLGICWCGLLCCIPLGFGVYGIIAMCLEPCRRYMASWNAYNSGFPVGGPTIRQNPPRYPPQ